MHVVDTEKLASLLEFDEDDVGLVDFAKLAEYDRQYYLRNKAKIRARNRQWRAKNKYKVKRRSRIYKRQLKMGRKPRKRIGAPGAGYTYVSRGGANFQRGRTF